MENVIFSIIKCKLWCRKWNYLRFEDHCIRINKMQRVKIKILQMNKVYGLFVLVYSNHYDNAKYLKLKDITYRKKYEL